MVYKDNVERLSMVGPFFYINGELIYHACNLNEGMKQADKINNPTSHEELFVSYCSFFDYIHDPRGRVIWDNTKKVSIIYIDPCINNSEVISAVISAYNIDDYVVRFDDHYHCRDCLEDDLFDDQE